MVLLFSGVFLVIMIGAMFVALPAFLKLALGITEEGWNPGLMIIGWIFLFIYYQLFLFFLGKIA